MLKLWTSLLVFLSIAAAWPPSTAASGGAGTDTARGIVFVDEDRDGTRDAGEAGLRGVGVTNGRRIVETDTEGRYRLAVREDQTIFVIKPRNYRFPVDRLGIPRSYYTHKPQGSPDDLEHPGVAPTGPLPDSIDFPLVPHPEPESFSALLLGDPQVRDETDLGYHARAVVDPLIGVDASFGLMLGDLAYDDLSIYPALNALMSKIGLVWINVHGNHDINFDVTSDRLSDETWERVYGPPTWSFEWGPAHFVILDDVIYEGDPSSMSYHAGLRDDQRAFLEADLARVDPDRLVVLAMHIPLQDFAPEQRAAFLEHLSRFDRVLVLTAHWHIQMHSFFERDGQPAVHQLVQATACGSWWLGADDPFGIPHATMRDGAPKGYSLLHIDGSDYTIEFRPFGQPADEQMHVSVPAFLEADAARGREVLINVYAGSRRSKVEMRVNDGPWRAAAQIEDRVDPRYQAIVDREQRLDPARRKLPDPIPSPHLWRASLPTDLSPGAHVLEVRTIDVFDQTHRARRTFIVR